MSSESTGLLESGVRKDWTLRTQVSGFRNYLGTDLGQKLMWSRCDTALHVDFCESQVRLGIALAGCRFKPFDRFGQAAPHERILAQDCRDLDECAALSIPKIVIEGLQREVDEIVCRNLRNRADSPAALQLRQAYHAINVACS